MGTALHWMGRHGTLTLPLGVALGLAVQPLAAEVRSMLAGLMFITLVLIFTRLDVFAALAHLRRPKVVPLAVLVVVVAVPLLASGFLRLFPQSPGLTAALILYTSAPPNFSAAALAFVLGVDGALAVAVILSCLVLHPVLTPLFTEFVTAGAVRVPAHEIGLRLFVLIGGAAIVAAVLRRIMGEARRRRAGPAIDGANVTVMLVFIIGVMDGIPDQIAAGPGHALVLLAIAFSLHIVLNLVIALGFWWTGLSTAVTVGYCAGGRNMASAMAVLANAVPAETWLFFAMLQFPIAFMPMLLKPIYRRLLAPRRHPS